MWSQSLIQQVEEEVGEEEEEGLPRKSSFNTNTDLPIGKTSSKRWTSGNNSTQVGSNKTRTWPGTMAKTGMEYARSSPEEGDEEAGRGKGVPLPLDKLTLQWDQLDNWNDPYSINGRDSGIHLDEDSRLDQSGSDLRSEQSFSDLRSDQSNTDLSRLSQSSPDLGIAHSEPDLLRPNLSDLYASCQFTSDRTLDQSDPDIWGVDDNHACISDEDVDDDQSTPRHHPSYLTPDANTIDIDSCRRLDAAEPNEMQKVSHPLTISISQNDDYFLSDDEVSEQDSSQDSSSLSPLALHGGQIYKTRGFTDLSLNTEDNLLPLKDSTDMKLLSIDPRPSQRSPLGDHFEGNSISLKEWTDGIQMYANDFDLEGYLTGEGIIPESNPFHPQTLKDGQYLDISYERRNTRPKDFWADDEEDDEEDEGCGDSSSGGDRRFSFEDEFFLEGGEVDFDGDWENTTSSFLNWVPQFSHSPGLRPISNYRIFQPGYLEAIAEDDEPVTGTSDNESYCSISNDKRTMEGSYTEVNTTSTTDKMARKNGVQREDSGIVIDSDMKDQPDVIPYNTKTVDMNGCTDEHLNGEIVNIYNDLDKHVNLINGVDKEGMKNMDHTNGTLEDEGAGESQIGDNNEIGQSYSNKSHENQKDEKPQRKVTTVILTKKEYLANGHCRTTTETTRTIREINGEETLTVDVKVETTEPPMPQLKEEPEPEQQPSTDTSNTEDETQKQSLEKSPQIEETKEEEIPIEEKTDDVTSSAPISTDSSTEKEEEKYEIIDSEQEKDNDQDSDIKKDSDDQQETKQDENEDQRKGGNDHEDVKSDIQENPKELVVEITSKTESKTVESLPPQPCPQPTEDKFVSSTTSTEEKIIPQTQETNESSLPQEPEPVEEVIIPTKSQRISSPLPPEFQPHHQPTVVVTDPDTEGAICQNNNNLVPCNGVLLDANVIADLVYKRFRPNVNKKKLVILLFPPPYQDLGEPVEVQEEPVTVVSVQKTSALPQLMEVDNDEREKDDELKKAEDESGEEDGPQSKRRRSGGFFRRVVQAVRRAFNRG